MWGTVSAAICSSDWMICVTLSLWEKAPVYPQSYVTLTQRLPKLQTLHCKVCKCVVKHHEMYVT
jgi:hypothetical protein